MQWKGHPTQSVGRSRRAHATGRARSDRGAVAGTERSIDRSIDRSRRCGVAPAWGGPRGRSRPAAVERRSTSSGARGARARAFGSLSSNGGPVVVVAHTTDRLPKAGTRARATRARRPVHTHQKKTRAPHTMWRPRFGDPRTPQQSPQASRTQHTSLISPSCVACTRFADVCATCERAHVWNERAGKSAVGTRGFDRTSHHVTPRGQAGGWWWGVRRRKAGGATGESD